MPTVNTGAFVNLDNSRADIFNDFRVFTRICTYVIHVRSCKNKQKREFVIICELKKLPFREFVKIIFRCLC